MIQTLPNAIFQKIMVNYHFDKNTANSLIELFESYYKIQKITIYDKMVKTIKI